jgi:hypothetical protein
MPAHAVAVGTGSAKPKRDVVIELLTISDADLS